MNDIKKNASGYNDELIYFNINHIQIIIQYFVEYLIYTYIYTYSIIKYNDFHSVFTEVCLTVSRYVVKLLFLYQLILIDLN